MHLSVSSEEPCQIEPMDGFLNLHKPLQYTSHDCVARVRRLLKTPKVGHAGTLDPAAAGVLPIAVGRATRLLQFLPTSKAYRAIVRFGLTTTTDDLAGEILTESSCPDLQLAQIETELPTFLGKIQQIPPAFSAIQVQGKRLYDLARAGQTVEVPMREVDVSEISVLDWRSQTFPEVDLVITCGGGTYIRAIARDLGAALGTGATLAGLVRTQSSGFDLADSWTFEDMTAAIEAQTFTLRPVEAPLLHHPALLLQDEETWRWCNGQKIAPPENFGATGSGMTIPALGQIFRVLRTDPETGVPQFLGMGEIQHRDGQTFLKAKMVYADCPCDRPASALGLNPAPD